MNRRPYIIAIIIAVLFFVPGASGAGKLDSLKAVHANMMEAMSALDAERYAKGVHENWVWFGTTEFLPVYEKSKDSVLITLNAIFAMYDSWEASPVNIDYRITNDVGVVTCVNMVTSKAKGGQPLTYLFREYHVYTMAGKKWLLTASSFTPIILGMSD